MIRNNRNNYNSNSYRNQSSLRSSSSLAQKRNYNTFQEDPQKAVFLSGFRTNIPSYKWKEYREAIYQDLQKYYGVYIRKLDLPVNHRFGYLHTKTVEQAENLLNLRNEQDNETGKILSQLDLARNTRNNWRTKICVYEYERKNEGRHHMNSSRNHSNERSDRNLNVRDNFSYNNSTNTNNRGYDTPQSTRSYQNYSNTRSRNDNSLSTNGFISDDFSRSISPSDNENQNNGHNLNYQKNSDVHNNNENNTNIVAWSNNRNSDSALQSRAITEPGSEDEQVENIENLLLKNRSKSTSTKTVVPHENVKISTESLDLDQQILNYENESDAEMNFSDDSDKILKTKIENESENEKFKLNDQEHVNFQEVAEQTRNKIIYEGLKQNWLNEYNFLSDNVQQQLMLNFHDACWTFGLEYAAQQLIIQGYVAISLMSQGIQTL